MIWKKYVTPIIKTVTTKAQIKKTCPTWEMTQSNILKVIIIIIKNRFTQQKKKVKQTLKKTLNQKANTI